MTGTRTRVLSRDLRRVPTLVPSASHFRTDRNGGLTVTASRGKAATTETYEHDHGTRATASWIELGAQSPTLCCVPEGWGDKSSRGSAGSTTSILRVL
jgi:hypothetical protein